MNSSFRDSVCTRGGDTGLIHDALQDKCVTKIRNAKMRNLNTQSGKIRSLSFCRLSEEYTIVAEYIPIMYDTKALAFCSRMCIAIGLLLVLEQVFM